MGVVLSPIRGGYIPPKGWFYPPKGVVLSPIKVGIKPPWVVLRVVLSPIWGWFYARDQTSGVGGRLARLQCFVGKEDGC